MSNKKKGFLGKVFEETGKTFEKAKSEVEKTIDERTAKTRKEVTETSNSILITVELPGARKEDTKINITDEEVDIRAVFDKTQVPAESRRITAEDRKRGVIIRNYKLPAKVIAEEAEAEFKNNALIIEIPKVGQKKGFEVKIK
jgi:HSP20 family protein